jgi:hypothetical protein
MTWSARSRNAGGIVRPIELRRSLYRQFPGARATEDAIDVGGHTLKPILVERPVGEEAAVLRKAPMLVDGRHAVLGRQLQNQRPLAEEKRVRDQDQRVRLVASHRLERRLELGGLSDIDHAQLHPQLSSRQLGRVEQNWLRCSRRERRIERSSPPAEPRPGAMRQASTRPAQGKGS